jgi:hypothetical protein
MYREFSSFCSVVRHSLGVVGRAESVIQYFESPSIDLFESECKLLTPMNSTTLGSRDLRQMSEYPIPHGGQYHSYILRRWRSAFLHPKEEIQICHRADEQNALKIVPFQ